MNDKEVAYELKLYEYIDKSIDGAIKRHSSGIDLKFENVILRLDQSNETLKLLTHQVKTQNGNVAQVKKDIIDIKHARELDAKDDYLNRETRIINCPFKGRIEELELNKLNEVQDVLTKQTMRKYLRSTLGVVVIIVSLAAIVFPLISKLWLLLQSVGSTP